MNKSKVRWKIELLKYLELDYNKLYTRSFIFKKLLFRITGKEKINKVDFFKVKIICNKILNKSKIVSNLENKYGNVVYEIVM